MPHYWEDTPNNYKFTTSMTAGVYGDSGVALGDGDDILAAFDGDGNVRGVSIMLGGIKSSSSLTLHAITIRSNNVDGDEISFKYYDASEDIILNIQESYTFVINDLVGNLVTPHPLNIRN